MNILLIAILVLLGIQCAGFGISGLLHRGNSEKAVAYAPLFGLAYLMFFSWWAYRLGFKVNGAVTLAIVLPAALLSMAVGARWWKGRLPTLGIRWLQFSAMWLIAAEIILLPVFFRDDILILTLGNNDVAHHSAISRFLMEQSRFHLQGLPAQVPHAFLWFADNTFFGYFSLIANVASLAGKLPHEVLTAVQVCIAALVSGPVFLLIRRVLHLPRNWGLFWATLSVAHALSLFVFYHGFGGQIFGTYFGFALIHWFVAFPRPPWPGVTLLKFVGGGIVLCVGIVLCYPHMLPFVAVVTGAWVVADAWSRGLLHSLLPRLSVMAAAALVCCMVIPNRLWGFYLWLRQAASDDSGWAAQFLWPDYLLGLIGTQMDQAHVAIAQPAIRFTVLTLLAALVIAQFLPSPAHRRRPLFALLLVVGGILVGAGIIAFLRSPLNSFGDYRSFKVLTFFAPLVTVMLGACWLRWWRAGRLWRITAGIILVGYVSLWGRGVFAMVEGDGRGNSMTYAAADAITSIPRDFASLNIVTQNHWASMWLGYFFLDKPSYQTFRSYYPASDLHGAVSFVARSSKFMTLEGFDGIPTGFGLTLYRTASFATCYFGPGWHGEESDRAWMGALGTDAEIMIVAPGNTAEIHASLDLWQFLPGNDYSAYWNDIPVIEHSESPSFVLKLAPVRPGVNVLRLRSKLPPQAPGNGDSRPICFGLKKMELKLLP